MGAPCPKPCPQDERRNDSDWIAAEASLHRASRALHGLAGLLHAAHGTGLDAITPEDLGCLVEMLASSQDAVTRDVVACLHPLR